MATPATTSTVYVHVIEDVINKVRDDFINGPGESVLNDLQSIWEMKMMQAGAIVGPIERGSGGKQGGGLHDLNVPYEGTEEYETPTAEMLFPPTPAQTPMPTPLPGTAQTPLPGAVQTPLPGGSMESSSMYNIPTGGSDYPTPISDTGGSTENKPARPSPYMQPPSFWATQSQRTPNLDVNVAYEEGRDEVDRGGPRRPPAQDFISSSGKRKRGEFGTQHSNGGFIPQQDGAGDAESADCQRSKENDSLGRYITTTTGKSSLQIPQVDGPIPDPYEDELSTPNIYGYQVNEDYNVASTPAPEFHASTPAIIPQNDFGDDVDDEDDEPLNEDDDDDEDLDDEDEGEELNTQHLVLAQFDKVTRTKSRWKCTLKDGIMHINNKDILFNKATGEFDF